MGVLILHDAVPPDAAPEVVDTLKQACEVEAALRAEGVDAQRLPVGGNLDDLQRQLCDSRPTVVFNLVESIAGADGAAVAVPALLDSLGIAYTGSNAAAQALANDKCMAKAFMRRAGLPTANWYPGVDGFVPGVYLIKTRFEHGSCGIDDEAVRRFDHEFDLQQAVSARQQTLGRPCFAEGYLEGREFNLSVIEWHDGLRVLPAAEIDFSAFAPGKPRIVGYRAKWVEDSFEYAYTPRLFPELTAGLSRRLIELSEACFRLFGLAGYARVDFRLDSAGEPVILEVNPNPCLARDAGFVAALTKADIPFKEAMGHLVSRATCFE
ncbi:MAG: hypothetical protein R3E82_18980 [Pseudomonadales bacterium]|nr:hypothetical protein [Pseudomonadales bacterium]